MTFGVGGVKYRVPLENSRVAPYVLAGGGVGAVKRDVTFSTTAGDVNQYATIGTDLSGTETKAMISIGGGVDVAMGQTIVSSTCSIGTAGCSRPTRASTSTASVPGLGFRF